MEASDKNPLKIPVLVNIALVVFYSFASLALLFLAQHTTGLTLVGSALMFAIAMIAVHSLMHEAEHGLLHNNRTMNRFLGRWLCCLFIAPFSFLRHCHFQHHRKNRTDEELWDLYTDEREKWKKTGTLYGMMVGLSYFFLAFSVMLLAFAPKILYSKMFTGRPEFALYLEGSNTPERVRRFRLESLVVITFQLICFVLFQGHLSTWLLCYAVHGFLWSSQDYVNHAFSRRDIIQGAHNLKMPRWLGLIYLNINVHLAHHQNPRVPWIHLPRFIQNQNCRQSFFANYIRLWGGPRPTTEVNPGRRDRLIAQSQQLD